MKNKNVLISIIMSIYNENEDEIKQSIESILKQTHSNFEFIIVLDNPNNNLAKKSLYRYTNMDKRIIFIENEQNIGLAKSLNKGIKIASGKYIARMDADDISEKNRLEYQLKYMLKNKNIDLLFTWTKYIDEHNKIFGKFNPENKYCDNLKRYFFTKGLFSHPTLIIKSKLLKQLKYNSNLRYSQDTDLWLRCIQKNLKINILEKNLLKYRISEEDIEKKIKKYRVGSKYTLKALNNNFNNFKFNIYFYKAYINYLLRYLILLITPTIIIKLYLNLKR